MKKINNKIKLVIWDLDDTLWKGILSEDQIKINPDNGKLIKELTLRGIINSISSKNDYEVAKKKLQEIGLWDYFVFPQINWNPKGQTIKELIKIIGLRDENVLFIDDSIHNLKEVLNFCPSINVCTPDYISDLVNDKFLVGKEDVNMSRLNRYKILEKKYNSFTTSNLSNIEFLRKSEIKVEILHDCENEIDRISELVLRTNQLNYTKKRSTKEELLDEIQDPSSQCGYIKVKDLYGEYGISGFYLIKGGELIHFLFSCRILNMYIESWTYQHLNCPKLHIQGSVASKLDKTMNIDFINLKDNQQKQIFVEALEFKHDILMLGGCDLGQVVYYINSKNIDTQFNYVNSKNINVHLDHTFLLRQFYEKPNSDIIKLIENLPVIDISDIELKIFNTEWNTLITSPLNDYSRGLYKHKKTGFILPFDAFNIDWSNSKNWVNLPEHLQYVPISFFELLKKEFDFLGPITPKQFKKNLEWLLKLFDEKKFIFLNGAEFELEAKNPWEKDMHLRHKVMNTILEELKNNNKNVHVVDVNEFCRSDSAFRDNLRHYNKIVYKHIAESIIDTMNKIDSENRLFIRSGIDYSFRRVSSKVLSKIVRWFS